MHQKGMGSNICVLPGTDLDESTNGDGNDYEGERLSSICGRSLNSAIGETARLSPPRSPMTAPSSSSGPLF